VLYIVHFTAFSLGGPFFSGHGVVLYTCTVVEKSIQSFTSYPYYQYSYKLFVLA